MGKNNPEPFPDMGILDEMFSNGRKRREEKTALIDGLSSNLEIVTSLIKQVSDDAERVGADPTRMMDKNGVPRLAPLIHTSSLILATLAQLRFSSNNVR